jgi:Ran GTPase-activating protein 1
MTTPSFHSLHFQFECVQGWRLVLLWSAAMSDTVFTVQGERELVTKERAVEIIKPLLDEEKRKDITEIRLSGKSFGIESANVLAEKLQQSEWKALKVLDLSDIIAGRPEDEALQVLTIITSCFKAKKDIKKIVLSDNALGRKGKLLLCAVFTEKKLHTKRSGCL